MPDTTAVPRRAEPIAEYVAADHTKLVFLGGLPRVLEPVTLAESASHVWALVDGDRTEEQIVDELVEAFGAPRDQIARDVREFLAQLLELGLIQDDAHE